MVSNRFAIIINLQMEPYLSDILVADSADLLDVGSTLGDILKGVARELKLILDVGGSDDLNTGLGSDTTNVLLTQEVSV